MNQSFCQGTITIHAGKCLNLAVGQSLTPSLAPGTQTWGVPTRIGGAHQLRRCPPASAVPLVPTVRGKVRLWVSAGWKTGLSAIPPNFLEVWLRAGWLRGKHATYWLLQHPGFSLKTPIQKLTRSFADLRVRDQAREESSHRMRNWICLLDFLSLLYTV